MMNEHALKNRLHVIAKERHIPFNLCWKQLILERFLVRLSRSPYADKFIFKGGFLLNYLIKIGRETIDLDFLLTKMKANEDLLVQASHSIATVDLDDGFIFAFFSIEFLSQPHMNYEGYRITFDVFFQKMRDKIHIDIAMGDVVEAEYKGIELFQYKNTPFCEDAISLLVYPVESIFAEKLETVLSKGSSNSRVKDYHDLYLLVKNKDLIDTQKLQKAIDKTFNHRETNLSLIQFSQQATKVLSKLWVAHLNELDETAEDLNLPKDIETVIQEINAFLMAFNIYTPTD